MDARCRVRNARARDGVQRGIVRKQIAPGQSLSCCVSRETACKGPVLILEGGGSPCRPFQFPLLMATITLAFVPNCSEVRSEVQQRFWSV